MGIAEDIQRSPNRLTEATRFAGIWLAAIDGPVDPRERMEVALAIPNEPEVVSIERMAEEVAGLGERDVGDILRILRTSRMPRRTEWLIDFLIGVACADGRISFEERHALMLVADLLVAPPELLPARFEALTGLEFELPPDLSDPAYLEAREALAAMRERRLREEVEALASAPDEAAVAHAAAAAQSVAGQRAVPRAPAANGGNGTGPTPAPDVANAARDRPGRAGATQGATPGATPGAGPEARPGASSIDPVLAVRARALAVLGLGPQATPIEVKAAWRRLRREHHPDRHVGAGPEAEAAATRRFQDVQAAYELLGED